MHARLLEVADKRKNWTSGGGGLGCFAEQVWGLGIGKKKVSDFVLIYRPIVYSLLV
jgi:hypothetical protein